MPRPTKSEINAEILERAAGLFAKHGFERTSLQQIADALNYSKAGLLHHYPSKKALYDAVVAEYQRRVEVRIADLMKIPQGIERDRSMIENAVRNSYEWPGLVAFGHYLGRERPAENARLVGLGLSLTEAFGFDFATPDMERFIRAFSALAGANFAAQMAVTSNMKEEWREYIIAAAMNALGHGKDAASDHPG